MKRLTNALNSAYFEAVNNMQPRKARRRIVAYVESYDDIFFWRTVLGQFENDKIYFEIMLPTRMNQLERGKKAAIMRLLSGNVGRDMIACVDADYDYLIQGSTQTSKILLGNKYILHTYAYAIENFQCFAPSLHDVCVAVTLNDHVIFNFEEYLRQYSLAIFPLFVWSIWYYRTPDYKEFTITDFLRVIEPGGFNLGNPQGTITNVRRKVDREVRRLQSLHPDAKESYIAVKEDLKRLGVSPEYTYLYIHGHQLFNKVIMPMMKKVCDHLRHEREQEITRQSRHAVQRRNELSCYTKSQDTIQNALRKNTCFTSAPPYSRIVADVERLLEVTP